jgi:hypothetical protein
MIEKPKRKNRNGGVVTRLESILFSERIIELQTKSSILDCVAQIKSLATTQEQFINPKIIRVGCLKHDESRFGFDLNVLRYGGTRRYYESVQVIGELSFNENTETTILIAEIRTGVDLIGFVGFYIATIAAFLVSNAWFFIVLSFAWCFGIVTIIYDYYHLISRLKAIGLFQTRKT